MYYGRLDGFQCYGGFAIYLFTFRELFGQAVPIIFYYTHNLLRTARWYETYGGVTSNEGSSCCVQHLSGSFLSYASQISLSKSCF